MSLRTKLAEIQTSAQALLDQVDALEHEIDLLGVAGVDTTAEPETPAEDSTETTEEPTTQPITPPEETSDS